MLTQGATSSTTPFLLVYKINTNNIGATRKYRNSNVGGGKVFLTAGKISIFI